ncbi:MAG: hypothetical protein HN377_08910 [Alphaproteobacteria bacterium]|jgi:hypothetical protein|nr:hypothetical protein [Alphaproteobacteria bacterium]MBT7941719.1 hypothetical protein [Alphaproteobacteria bacterium]
MIDTISTITRVLSGLGMMMAVAGATLVFSGPSPVEAAAPQCSRLLPTGGREVIFNQCDKCRVVNITRSRPGNAIPISRSYNLRPKSKIDLPFRGPGRSRITSELPCKGDPGGAINLADPNVSKNLSNKKPETCVEMEKTPSGGMQLINKCKVCKAALIERQDSSGANGKRQAYKVYPKTPTPVPPKGAGQIALLVEIACP